MKTKHFFQYTFIGFFVVFLTGCLTERTVTQGGRTVKQEYVFKRPLKEAFQNSQ